MSIVEDFLKAIQATVTPELNTIKERMDANHRETMLRFEGINQRFDDLLVRLNFDRRLEAVERELDDKRKAS